MIDVTRDSAILNDRATEAIDAVEAAGAALSIAQERSLEMACGDDEGTDDEVAA